MCRFSCFLRLFNNNIIIVRIVNGFFLAEGRGCSVQILLILCVNTSKHKEPTLKYEVYLNRAEDAASVLTHTFDSLSLYPSSVLHTLYVQITFYFETHFYDLANVRLSPNEKDGIFEIAIHDTTTATYHRMSNISSLIFSALCCAVSACCRNTYVQCIGCQYTLPPSQHADMCCSSVRE